MTITSISISTMIVKDSKFHYLWAADNWDSTNSKMEAGAMSTCYRSMCGSMHISSIHIPADARSRRSCHRCSRVHP